MPLAWSFQAEQQSHKGLFVEGAPLAGRRHCHGNINFDLLKPGALGHAIARGTLPKHESKHRVGNFIFCAVSFSSRLFGSSGFARNKTSPQSGCKGAGENSLMNYSFGISDRSSRHYRHALVPPKEEPRLLVRFFPYPSICRWKFEKNTWVWWQVNSKYICDVHSYKF